MSPTAIAHDINPYGLIPIRERCQQGLYGSDRFETLTTGDYPNQTDDQYFTTYNNETILYVSWDKDAFTNRSDIGVISNASESDSTITTPSWSTPSWVEWANIEPQTQTSYTLFGATWKVPNKPKVNSEYTKFYYFTGINSNGRIKEGYKQGIVQPVLAWNCGQINATTHACSIPATENLWTGMAVTQYNTVPPSPQIISRKILVGPGDDIHGTLFWEGTDSWKVQFYDATTREVSVITSATIVPNDSDYVTPLITLESRIMTNHLPESTPNICKDGRNKDRWPQSKTRFTNIQIYDQTKKDITQQMKATGNYNRERFEHEEYNDFSCGKRSNYPQYDPSHYYVDTRDWNNARTIAIQPHQF